MAKPDVTSQVLTTEEVKDRLREIKEAVLHRNAVVHFGDRQRDDFVILKRARYEALVIQAERAALGETSGNPPSFLAGVGAAIRAGHLGGGARPRPREYTGPVSSDSTLTVSEMMGLGRGPDETPRHRRSSRP